MSVSQQATLKLSFQSYWHSGSGMGAGTHVDALCLRDQAGLPFLPGRQLKGVLRHAVRRAETWGWYEQLTLPTGCSSHERLLFGSQSQYTSRHETQPGLLLTNSACLPADERNWLAQTGQAVEREQIFGTLFSTAINEAGTAEEHSLRGLEVCLPVTLYAELSLAVTALLPQPRQSQSDWLTLEDPWRTLALALPLVDALGAHRSRGLGEVILKLKTDTHRGSCQ